MTRYAVFISAAAVGRSLGWWVFPALALFLLGEYVFVAPKRTK